MVGGAKPRLRAASKDNLAFVLRKAPGFLLFVGACLRGGGEQRDGGLLEDCGSLFWSCINNHFQTTRQQTLSRPILTPLQSGIPVYCRCHTRLVSGRDTLADATPVSISSAASEYHFFSRELLSKYQGFKGEHGTEYRMALTTEITASTSQYARAL